ncbi:hypothetical protein CKAH01_15799 [Colletotrichum kahawae]|uniref:Uncharacterized protein n=1 Tax=Colletotrichum kahawae TaxID=34407 RepID=A0AAE0D6C4_COLKA|nr:hypothetical protein CKAH01_15799 [Colletotrichum kahawae]
MATVTTILGTPFDDEEGDGIRDSAGIPDAGEDAGMPPPPPYRRRAPRSSSSTARVTWSHDALRLFLILA